MHSWVSSEALMKRWFDLSFKLFCIDSFKLLALQESFPQKSTDLVSQLHSLSSCFILSDSIQRLFFGNFIFCKLFKLLLEQDLLRVDIFVEFASCANSRFHGLVALFFKFLEIFSRREFELSPSMLLLISFCHLLLQRLITGRFLLVYTHELLWCCVFVWLVFIIEVSVDNCFLPLFFFLRDVGCFQGSINDTKMALDPLVHRLLQTFRVTVITSDWTCLLLPRLCIIFQ